MKTLGEFIVEKQQDFPHATGELTSLLAAIKLAAKIIHRDINKAGLVDILGANGLSNIQGESQMKLDLYANESSKRHCKPAVKWPGSPPKKRMTSWCSTAIAVVTPSMWC